MKTIELDSPEKRFQEEIEKMVKSGADYIDAVVTWCEKNNIEVEFAATLIKGNSHLKPRVRKTAEKLNFIQKKKSP